MRPLHPTLPSLTTIFSTCLLATAMYGAQELTTQSKRTDQGNSEDHGQKSLNQLHRTKQTTYKNHDQRLSELTPQMTD